MFQQKQKVNNLSAPDYFLGNAILFQKNRLHIKSDRKNGQLPYGLWHYYDICLDRLIKTTKILHQDSR